MKDENTMNAEDLLTWKGKPDISELLTNTPIHEALPIDQWYAGNKEFNEAMDRADAYLARVIDPLVLLQELDKLQRYQNGVRFSPDNLRRGQMKTKEIYAVIEKLMNKDESKESDPGDGYSPRSGVWAPKAHYDACKELDKNREEEFRLMMYGKNTDNETV